MKLNKSQLENIVGQEVKRVLEDVSVEDIDSYIDKLDEIRGKVDRLELKVSRKNFEGFLTRGDMKKVERNVEEIRQRLKNLEEIFINERGKHKGLD